MGYSTFFYIIFFHRCHAKHKMCCNPNFDLFREKFFLPDLQISRSRFNTEKRMFAFSLWNRILEGEIRFYRLKWHRTPIESLLQTGKKDSCVAMMLLFGRVPSWYNLPCYFLTCHIGPVICKRRIEKWRQQKYHITTRNDYTICQSKEMYVLRKCFVMKWGYNVLPSNEPAVTYDVQEYFIKIFSFITWQSLLGYQVSIKSNFSNSSVSESCINTRLTPGLPFDITRRAIIYRSPCKLSKSYRVLSIMSGSVETEVYCLANQVTCKDGTCLSHRYACSGFKHCQAVGCPCQMGGMTVKDQHFCLDICLPTNCTCPQHYFHCTSGGCIQRSSLCDGVSHCRDSSDEICEFKIRAPETKITEIEIPLTETFFCLGFLCHSGHCIYLRNVDDLIPDCPGGNAEDEPRYLQLRYNNKQYTCKDLTHIPCVPGLSVCFTFEQLCLYDSDKDGNPLWCRNGAHLADCSFVNCTNSYKCPESYCIPFHRVCDGYQDCIHGEDEEWCNAYSCKGLLRCTGSKVCVHPRHVCDGFRNCPSGDDEELCDLNFCPQNCSCISYSIECTISMSNPIPTMPNQVFKHISIASSHMPDPDFHNIRNQRDLLIFNLTGNHIHSICANLQGDGRFNGKIIILDLSHNEISSLQNACFDKLVSLKVLSLAYNPLQTLPSDSLSLLSIAYISLRSTHLKSSFGDSLSTNSKSVFFDIAKNSLTYLDSFAIGILSSYADLKFDDSRLCCIFTRNKYCLHKAKLLDICPTLLPHRFIVYIIFSTGALILVANVYAFYANLRLTRGSHYSKITNYLILIDAILASHLLVIGAADVYHKSFFPLAAEQWHRGVICRLLESVSTITITLSPLLSTLLVFLTSQGIIQVKYNIFDNFRFTFLAVAGMTLTVVCFSFSLTTFDIFSTDPVSSKRYMCIRMGYFTTTSKTDISFTITMSVLLLALALWSTISAMKLILFIRRISKEVRRISKMKGNLSRAKGDACKFMISLIAMKLIIFMPYPLLQITYLLADKVSEYSGMYVMLSFITLECSFNPTVFVLRPLLIKRKRTKFFCNRYSYKDDELQVSQQIND